MRVLWYFPFARPEEMPLACAVARLGPEITVQVIDRPAAPHDAGCAGVDVRADLPDVRRESRGRGRWLVSRARTYVTRARHRRALLQETAPDLLHIHYINRFTDWWTFRRFPRSSLVVSVHDVVPHRAQLPRPVEHWLLQRTYERAGALVVHHDVLREQLLATFDLEPRSVHVVPHQVFAYGDRVATPPPPGLHVLVFGALRVNKGIDVFLSALTGLPPEARVTIAGRGERELEEAVTAAAAADPRVHAEIGFASSERKSELFAAASLIVLPYTSFASQSGVLHDAYAHGRPVLVTDVGALGRTVAEDGTGVVVPADDPEALARAITALHEDSHRLDALRQRVADVVVERAPERIAVTLHEVYRSGLDEAERPTKRG